MSRRERIELAGVALVTLAIVAVNVRQAQKPPAPPVSHVAPSVLRQMNEHLAQQMREAKRKDTRP